MDGDSIFSEFATHNRLESLKILKRNNQLPELKLTNISKRHYFKKLIIEVVNICLSLQVLHLQGIVIDDEIINHLSKLKNLKSLNIKFNKANEDGIANLFESSSGLEEVSLKSLTRMKLHGKTIKKLKGGLTVFELSRIQLHMDGPSLLSRFSANLRKLRLEITSFNTIFYSDLTFAAPKLSELRLRIRRKLVDYGKICNFKNLKKLDLRQTSGFDDSHFNDIIQNCSSLKELKVTRSLPYTSCSDNNICIELIKRLKKLKKLSLSGGYFAQYCCVKYLSKCSNLEEFQISQQRLLKMSHILKIIRDCPKLKKITIKACDMVSISLVEKTVELLSLSERRKVLEMNLGFYNIQKPATETHPLLKVNVTVIPRDRDVI